MSTVVAGKLSFGKAHVVKIGLDGRRSIRFGVRAPESNTEPLWTDLRHGFDVVPVVRLISA